MLYTFSQNGKTVYGPNINVELRNNPTLYSSQSFNVTNKTEITHFLNSIDRFFQDTHFKVFHNNKMITMLILSPRSIPSSRYEINSTQTNNNNNFSPNTCVMIDLVHGITKKTRFIKILPYCDEYASRGLDNSMVPEMMDFMGLQKAIARAFANEENIKENITKELKFMQNHNKYLNKEIAATKIKRKYRNTWDPNHPMMQNRFLNLQANFNNKARQQNRNLN
jgi:hypothetical protein